MSDRLKLSDPAGDAELKNIVVALEQQELDQRIRQLEKNIAELQKAAADGKKGASAPAAPPNNKIGARKDSTFKAISTTPSVNKTPVGPSMVPIPYPTVQDLSNSINTARSVKFNGKPAYLLDQSTQPKGKGDEPGTGKGVKSGTVTGEVKPAQGCKTVRIEGKYVVREGDACTMNGGNNEGIFVTTIAPSGAPPRTAIETSNPPVVGAKPKQESKLQAAFNKLTQNIKEAIKNPYDGVTGAVKSVANTPSETGDLVLGMAIEQRSTMLDDAILTHYMFGQTDAAQALTQMKADTENVAHQADLPKFKMSNSAQEGGEAIYEIISVLPLGAGIIKNTGKLGTAIPKLKTSGSAKPIAVKGSSTGVKITPSVTASVSTSLKIKRLSYKPSSGANLVTNEGKTTTILGSYKSDIKNIIDELGNIKSTDLGPRVDGFNLLNIPDSSYFTPDQFWKEYNQPWLQNAVDRNDRIIMATEPNHRNSSITHTDPITQTKRLSGFGKEYKYLRDQGYIYDKNTKEMIRK